MAELLLVTSGKGGVGKSSCCIFTGEALMRQGKRVLIMELDAGMRGLDMMMGLENKTAYDIGDVIRGRCEPIKAIAQSDEPFVPHLMCAPTVRWSDMESANIVWLCRGLAGYYDYILIDSPAGVGQGFEIGLAAADRAIIVATPDPISVRDGGRVSAILWDRGIGKQRLIINKVARHYAKLDLMPDLDAVIDGVGAQLIGVVPEDEWVLKSISKGLPLPKSAKAWTPFESIASRIMGEYRPLSHVFSGR